MTQNIDIAEQANTLARNVHALLDANESYSLSLDLDAGSAPIDDQVFSLLRQNTALTASVASYYESYLPLVSISSVPMQDDQQTMVALVQLFLHYQQHNPASFSPELIINAASVNSSLLTLLLASNVFSTLSLHSPLPSTALVQQAHAWRDVRSANRSISYTLNVDQPPWPKASQLLPDEVMVDLVSLRVDHSQAQACVEHFFDAPLHKYIRLRIDLLEHAYMSRVFVLNLPQVDVRSLEVMNPLVLTPGSNVELCEYQELKGPPTLYPLLDLTGSSCFELEIFSFAELNPELYLQDPWWGVAQLSEGTKCTKLKCFVDRLALFEVLDHPLLLHIEILFLDAAVRKTAETKKMLRALLGRLPALKVAYVACSDPDIDDELMHGAVAAHQLVLYYTVCRQGLALGDYGMLLKDDLLNNAMQGVYNLHAAVAVATDGYAIPDAVGRALLEAVVLCNKW